MTNRRMEKKKCSDISQLLLAIPVSKKSVKYKST